MIRGQENRGSNPSGNIRDIQRPGRLLALKVIAQESQLSLWDLAAWQGHGLDTEAALVKGPARMCKCMKVAVRGAYKVCVCICRCVHMPCVLRGGRWQEALKQLNYIVKNTFLNPSPTVFA